MKNIKRNDALTAFSQSLRKNMTKEERHLWYDFLKNLDLAVHRQYVIGQYIADFYIGKFKIVIELDGGGHYESEQQEYDIKRNTFMQSIGLTVLRYSNRDIRENFRGVCEDILLNIEKKKQVITAEH